MLQEANPWDDTVWIHNKAKDLVKLLVDSTSRCPMYVKLFPRNYQRFTFECSSLREAFVMLNEKISLKFPEQKHQGLAYIIFYRFLCPVIESPIKYDILDPKGLFFF